MESLKWFRRATWISTGDHAGTNDSDEQTVDSRSLFTGGRFS